MLVQADNFHRRVVLRRKAAAERNFDKLYEQLGPDDHVQSVQASHAEVERKIELSMGLDVRVVVRGSGLLQLFLLNSKFFRIISGRGVLDAIPNIKAVTGDQMVVEFLLVFD